MKKINSIPARPSTPTENYLPHAQVGLFRGRARYTKSILIGMTSLQP